MLISADDALWLLLRRELSYETNTGIWNRRIERRKAKYRGKQTGTLRKDGYKVVVFNGKLYLSSRLAWFYMTREWPNEIDHIDRNPSNDRWINLRDVTHSENCKNRSA